jgi:hypothetical protein
MTSAEMKKWLLEQQRMNKLRRTALQERAKIKRSEKTKTMREQMDNLYKRLGNV